MTSGTVTRDYTTTTPYWEDYYNWARDGSTFAYSVDHGMVPVGSKSVRSYSGADRPAKATYEVVTWFDPRGKNGGRFRKARLRTDKPRRSKNEFHSYYADIRISNWGPCHFIERTGGNITREWWGSGGPGSDTPSWNFEEADQYVVNDWNDNDTIALIQKLQDKVFGSSFDLSVFLGEGREALSMITTSANRLYKMLKAVKHGDLSKVKKLFDPQNRRRWPPSRVAKTPGSWWLELQYGWLPLLKDIDAAAQFLAKTLNVPMERTYTVRKTKLLDYNSYVESKKPNFEAFGANYSVVKGQLICRVREVDYLSTLGLESPATVAWELLPWSFVADWFIPIGNFLAARNFVNSVKGEYCLTLTKRDSGYYQWPKAKTGTFSTECLSSVSVVKRIVVNRTASENLTVPPPQAKALEKVGSLGHCLNALALITQFDFSPKFLTDNRKVEVGGRVFKWHGVRG